MQRRGFLKILGKGSLIASALPLLTKENILSPINIASEIPVNPKIVLPNETIYKVISTQVNGGFTITAGRFLKEGEAKKYIDKLYKLEERFNSNVRLNEYTIVECLASNVDSKNVGKKFS